jgi:hypothetical protein
MCREEAFNIAYENNNEISFKMFLPLKRGSANQDEFFGRSVILISTRRTSHVSNFAVRQEKTAGRCHAVF